MILVPRQLMRSGMTGDVPYYGGRFTPAQAYAASHPRPPSPSRHRRRSVHLPARSPSLRLPTPTSPCAACSTCSTPGVVTQAEYDGLRARVTG